MPLPIAQSQKAAQRLQRWRPFYLAAAQDMFEKAQGYRAAGDYIPAYLCLWVSFNNLYSLLADFCGSDRAKLSATLQSKLPDSAVEGILVPEFRQRFHEINDRKTREVPGQLGLVDMQAFFQGQPVAQCIKRVNLAEPGDNDTATAKRKFLVKMVDVLLYTVRNNLFHAVNGPKDGNDYQVVINAYPLLEPLVEPLLQAAKNQIPNAPHA